MYEKNKVRLQFSVVFESSVQIKEVLWEQLNLQNYYRKQGRSKENLRFGPMFI